MSDKNLQKEPPKKDEVRKIAALDDNIQNHDNVLDIITEIVEQKAEELQDQESTDRDVVEAERERLSNQVFSGDTDGYDQHSALGGTSKVRPNDDESEKSEENLTESEREQKRLARDVFETVED
jgi:hypothetical protein